MKSKLRLLLASLVTAAACGTASAQQLENVYVEGIAGISSFKLSTGIVTNNTFTQTLPTPAGTAPNTVTITGTDKSDMALGLRVGYDLTDRFAFEIAYINLGTATISGTGQMFTPALSASALTFTHELEITKWTFGFAGKHSVGDKLTLVGRVGFGTSRAEWAKTIVTTTVTGTAQAAGKFLHDALPDQQRKVGFDAGIQASFQINEKLSLNGAYDYLSGRQTTNLLSASLKYSF